MYPGELVSSQPVVMYQQGGVMIQTSPMIYPTMSYPPGMYVPQGQFPLLITYSGEQCGFYGQPPPYIPRQEQPQRPNLPPSFPTST